MQRNANVYLSNPCDDKWKAPHQLYDDWGAEKTWRVYKEASIKRKFLLQNPKSISTHEKKIKQEKRTNNIIENLKSRQFLPSPLSSTVKTRMIYLSSERRVKVQKIKENAPNITSSV